MNHIALTLITLSVAYTFKKLVLRPAVKAAASLPWGDYCRIIREAVRRAIAALLGR